MCTSLEQVTSLTFGLQVYGYCILVLTLKRTSTRTFNLISALGQVAVTRLGPLSDLKPPWWALAMPFPNYGAKPR